MQANIPLEIYTRCFKLVEYIRDHEGCKVTDLLDKFRSEYLKTSKDRDNTNEKAIRRSIQRDLKKLQDGLLAGVKVTFSNRIKGTYTVEIDNESIFEQILQNVYLLTLHQKREEQDEKTSDFLKRTISYDQRSFRGARLLPLFIQAIQEKKQIRFSFKEYEREERTVRLSVLGLKQFDSRWYVIGRNHNSDNNHELNRFDLDRCNNANILDRDAQKEDFDIHTFFEGTYGVIRGIEEDKAIENIVLKADYRQACYLKSAPLHPSQTWIDIDEDAENGSIFTLKLSPTYDFKMKVLGMGAKVEVLEPKGFRDEMKGELEESLKKYNKKL